MQQTPKKLFSPRALIWQN